MFMKTEKIRSVKMTTYLLSLFHFYDHYFLNFHRHFESAILKIIFFLNEYTYILEWPLAKLCELAALIKN